jgi:hypothetical protein
LLISPQDTPRKGKEVETLGTVMENDTGEQLDEDAIFKQL